MKAFDAAGRIVRQTPLRWWAASLDVARESGDILVGESRGYERLDANYHSQFVRDSKSRVSCIQGLPGGEVLICEPDIHRVTIADAEGAVVWQLSNLEGPWRALYLP